MWKLMSAKTPCVIIECGVGMHVPDDHEILHFNRPLVVEGIVKGICLAFNVPYVVPTTTTSTVLTSTSSSSSTTTAPPDTSSEVTVLKEKLSRVHDIIWGKGWPWAKINAEKVLIPK